MSIEDGIRNFVEKNPKYNIYENYSGRGMFGRTCLGVVVSRIHSWTLLLSSQSIWMTMVLKMLISHWRGYPTMPWA